MTIETHGMEFVVDASGVEKGFRDYESAVQGIFKSLDQFEKKVSSTMKGIESAANNKAALSNFKKSLAGLSNIPIDTQAARKLSTLSAAMAGFKAPSAAQAANTRKFFTSLQGLPDLSEAFRSIKNLGSLKSSMEGFKAPSLAQAKNLREFASVIEKAAPAFRNLRGIAGVSGIANELASISIAMKNLRPPSASQITNLGNMGLALQHLGRANTGNTGQMLQALAGINNFRAPSPAQIRNLENFVNALHKLQPITNAGAIAAGMNQIANAASNASNRLGGFRSNLGGFNPAYGRFNAGTHSARLEMMGLQNAFSGTFQVGSVLRSLLGSLTIGELGREFFKATQTANQFHASMEVLGMTPLMQGAAWERVRQDANHFGADLSTFAEGFAKFAAAAHESGMQVGESFKVYEGFQTVMSTLHLGTEQQNSVGLAIREIMDKGYVSTQQLTRQLGLVLPGALSTLQKAWAESGKKGVNFFDALKKKMVDGQWALDTLADHYKETYGPALAKALESPIQQFNILKNNIMDMMVAVGDAGAKKGFADLIKQISSYIDPKAANGFAKAIGGGLTTALNKASDAIRVLHDNWESIKGPLGTAVSLMGKWMILSATLAIGRSILSPLMALRAGLAGFNTALTGTATRLPLITRGFQALAAGTVPLASSFTRLNSGGLMANAMLNTMSSTSRLAGVQFRLLQGAIMAPTIATNALRVGFNGLKAVGTGLMNLVGGPWSALMIAFGVAIGGVSSAIMDLAMHHADAQRVIQSAAPIFEENADLLGKQATNATLAKLGVNDFGAYTASAAGPVKAFAGVVGGLADQLYRAADAARQANIQNIKAKITETETMRQTRFLDTQEGLFQRKPGEDNSMKHVWQRGTHRIGTMINNWWDDGEDNRAAHQDVGRANQLLKGGNGTVGLYDLLKKAESETLEQFAGRTHMTDLYKEMDPNRSPLYSGVDANGKPKKGKKGPDPYTAINKTENAIDDLMKRLDASDPIGKLYDDFTKNITKESKDLLTASGHKAWLADVQKTGKSANDFAASSTEALIRQLESGVGINQKNLADLEKRYGMTIPQIVQKLKNQLDDLHAHEVEAMKKTIDEDTKSIAKARDAIGNFDPMTKLNDDAVGRMDGIAQQLFKGNAQAYSEWYKPLKDGSRDATQGLELLSLAMQKALVPGTALNANFKQMGISADRATQIMAGWTQQLAYQQAQEAENMTFGAKLLTQKNEEIALMRLGTNQAEIMRDLQQEVNDKVSSGVAVTADMVAHLKDELVTRKALADQMQRNKDFFENNGVRSYLNDLQDVGSAVNDLDKNVFQSLEDQLISLGTTGKFSFKSIFDTIQAGIIKMAAQGLTKNFGSMLFGQKTLDGGAPSLFGSTIGKWFGGYKPNQNSPLGSNGPDQSAYPWASDFKSATVDTITGKLGATQMNALWVRDANNPMGTPNNLLGGGGTGGPISPNGAGWGFDSDGYLTPSRGGTSSDTSSLGSGLDFNTNFGTGTASPAAAAGAEVANSFKTNMGQMIPMVGMMFAGAFKSPIAQVGAMFASMLLSNMGGGGGGGGAGGILGSIMGMFGGGGGAGMSSIASAGMDFGSIGAGLDFSAFAFREGGISHLGGVSSQRMSPAAFVNAPHYREGTANTSGGIPAVLHDNEAVIPLSRGRKVAVELTGKSSGANGNGTVINFNVNSPDADSFRKSKQQVATDLHGAATRAFLRNNP